MNDIIENHLDDKHIHAYLFVYDASDWESFLKLYQIIDTILLAEKCKYDQQDGAVFKTKKVLVGNKKDLKLQKHILTIEDKHLVKDFRRFEVSAATNLGIKEIFHEVVKSLIDDEFIKKELESSLA